MILILQSNGIKCSCETFQSLSITLRLQNLCILTCILSAYILKILVDESLSSISRMATILFWPLGYNKNIYPLVNQNLAYLNPKAYMRGVELI